MSKKPKAKLMKGSEHLYDIPEDKCMCDYEQGPCYFHHEMQGGKSSTPVKLAKPVKPKAKTANTKPPEVTQVIVPTQKSKDFVQQLLSGKRRKETT